MPSSELEPPQGQLLGPWCVAPTSATSSKVFFPCSVALD